MAGAAKSNRSRRRKRLPLDRRFTFLGDAVAVGDRKALRSAQFEVLDTASGIERSLKLWRKTGAAVDADLRQLWLHEMRQVQRVMSYSGAREVVVDILEFVEDDDEFGVLLETAGQPLTNKLQRVSRQHWLKNLGAPRPRALFWRNIRRIVDALGIVHAQGLVHGNLSTDSLMTEGAEDPDFQLTGFEWSLWLTADKAQRTHARLGGSGDAVRAQCYSFEEDWKALGRMTAHCLDAVVRTSGDVQAAGKAESPIALSLAERALIKRLAAPTRFDNLDVVSLGRAIDDIVAEVGRPGSARAGSFILMFSQNAGLGGAVYTVTDGAIPEDEYRDQLDWVRADLDRGVALLVPREFAPGQSRLQLVSDQMIYTLGPLRQEGTAAWDVAVCSQVKPRGDALRLGGHDEHDLVQPITVATAVRTATDLRARLGPEALDWSGFATAGKGAMAYDQVDLVRQALLLIQIVEAVIKSLEVYPLEVLEIERREGRRYAIVRAEPNNDRDRLARKVGLVDTENALKRLFEDDHRDGEAKWRISQAATLGASRTGDVVATFIELREHRGRHGYRFEIDEALPSNGPFFLRTERDTGTEGVISRRLRNIKALGTRVDLAEMLTDPWRVRRSSRETLDDSARADAHFQDLDLPKRAALEGLWSTLPSYFVVGPPGVGKTRLATETVRRRFSEDRSTRILLTAQGHDALDHLQEEVKATLHANGMDDVILVRSTASERRPRSDQDLHATGLDYLRRLSESPIARDAPGPLRDRVVQLLNAGQRLTRSKDAVDKDDRVALNAVSSLILDAANIVVSTANSPDVERLIEAREQFDWVIVEEAAKATGPELAGPMMLSGRRLLIGDHHQLPPFDADRLVKVLQNHALVGQAIELADQFVGPLLRDGESSELTALTGDANRLRDVTDTALRLFEPFRTFVEEDERRRLANPNHRTISGTLTEQRRMDPAIARVVSQAFYGGALETQPERANAAFDKPRPFEVLAPLPASPIVIANFKHVSATGARESVEHARPRWHNPGEVDAVVSILEYLRARDGEKSPSLVVLSFYNAQVDKLSERIDGAVRSGPLAHLGSFRPVVQGGKWVTTVDGFQGNEADVVVLSLVRNNAGSGMRALGFLRDKRRMNVALSRAKSKLIIVGSVDFLREAVRGVNPDAGSHDLSFLNTVAETLDALTGETRPDGIPQACFVDPAIFLGQRPC
ncbi:AAA family ATPase [Erythrobacter sp. 3-20A1M]|uniref:DEAD/DEAH box helicase family protein n=1 Tax=Erythrobacter sp. 3-20A1M TaxID=2653850 RepID=UPI001BFC192A|nr:ATP-binding protein [Erythrobacter sp. 3-20A1M]QWC57449.1 AAA family ATPase [Erythrobacter sp. 3-20A1M]